MFQYYYIFFIIMNSSSLQSLASSTADIEPISSISTNTPMSGWENTQQSTNMFSDNSIFQSLSEIGWQTWAIIILLLMILGINIFAYIAKGTDESAKLVRRYLGPLLKMLGFLTLETTKQTIQTSGTGAVSGIQTATDATVNTIDAVQRGKIQIGESTNNTSSTTTSIPSNNDAGGSNQGSSYPSNNVSAKVADPGPQWYETTLNNALDDASTLQNQIKNEETEIEAANSGEKEGWCYIGIDRGVRSCSQVGPNDQCMSGDIFPSQDICMNPRLRQ